MADGTAEERPPGPPTPLSEEALETHQQGLASEDQAGNAKASTASDWYLEIQKAFNNLQDGTNERLNQFERRIKEIQGSESETASLPSEISDGFELEDDYRLGYEENTIPKVKDTDFEPFKNRFGDEDGKHCIEVLLAGSDLDDQIRHELGRRDGQHDKDYKRRVDYDDTDETIIQRVRIQSPALLWLLWKALGEGDAKYEWKGQNRTTFYRPFSWFVYVQAKMEDELKKLEDKWSDASNVEELQNETVQETVARLKQSLPTEETSSDAASSYQRPELIPSTSGKVPQTDHQSLARRTERGLLQEALLENYHTLLELQCYVEFVEKRIIPPTRRYDDPDKPEARMIRYQDLWLLFPPGELLVTSAKRRYHTSDSLPKEEIRIARCLGYEKPDATTNSGWAMPYYPACQTSRRSSAWVTFDLYCHTLGYNGEEFGRVDTFIRMGSFDGLMKVTSLQVFPLRFYEDQDEVRKILGTNGSAFKEALSACHMAYRGRSQPWSTASHSKATKDAEAKPKEDNREDTTTILRESIYIESDVIVDVKEAIQVSSNSDVPFSRGHPIQSPITRACQDSVEIVRWKDKKRTERLTTIQDRTQTGDAVAWSDANQFMDTYQFISPQKDPMLTPDDLLLLPNGIYAYALRERKFFKADVRYLRRLQTETDAFENLKIDPDNVRLVQAAVASHFQRKEVENHPKFVEMMDQDLIRGKGRGLVILLHGAPGVGKTATAEAVALKFDCPLFVITCGDLGFTPEGVESSLNEIFRLAHLWNCILLLDEADVFLSQRENNSLQRNALVSVFLRVLEYYNGILFLTTNRVGSLDEAFKSRVHLSLYYPALGVKQTQEIIRMNLARLRTIEKQRAEITGKPPLFIEEEDICSFSVDHYERHSANNGVGRWNGRQIRNAVQIAASLAWYDRKTSKDEGADQVAPVLGSRHFRTVESTMTLFEGYMVKTKGGDDAFMARERGDRYDQFTPQDPKGWGRAQTQASEPDPFGPFSSRGIGGYRPYQNTATAPQQPGWPQQQAKPNAPGPSSHHMTGSAYAGSPAQPYQQNMSQYPPQAQAHPGFGAQVQQHTPLTPSPSFSSVHPDRRPQMAPGGPGAQAYPATQMPPQAGPREPYGASRAMYDVEQELRASYQHEGSASLPAHQTSNDAFSSPGADVSHMSQGGMNPAQGQPSHWPGTQSALG
ncbi:hypothetical protein PG984_013911 [Apiospora sp. TS-2023a]